MEEHKKKVRKMKGGDKEGVFVSKVIIINIIFN